VLKHHHHHHPRQKLLVGHRMMTTMMMILERSKPTAMINRDSLMQLPIVYVGCVSCEQSYESCAVDLRWSPVYASSAYAARRALPTVPARPALTGTYRWTGHSCVSADSHQSKTTHTTVLRLHNTVDLPCTQELLLAIMHSHAMHYQLGQKPITIFFTRLTSKTKSKLIDEFQLIIHSQSEAEKCRIQLLTYCYLNTSLPRLHVLTRNLSKAHETRESL